MLPVHPELLELRGPGHHGARRAPWRAARRAAAAAVPAARSPGPRPGPDPLMHVAGGAEAVGTAGNSPLAQPRGGTVFGRVTSSSAENADVLCSGSWASAWIVRCSVEPALMQST